LEANGGETKNETLGEGGGGKVSLNVLDSTA